MEEKQRLAASQKAQQTASLKKWLWPALILLSLMIGYWALSEFPDPKPTPTADIPASPVEAPPASAFQEDPWQSPVDGMIQAYIPAGEFEMGSENGADDEQPIHTVYLDAFWMDTTEVTNAQYAKCVEAGDCSAPQNVSSRTRSDYYTASKYGNYPVIFVSWDDANDYCTWAGRRLPTEAEWEKAARGGLESMQYPWGNQEPSCQLGVTNGANYSACRDDDTIEVASFGANGYGLYDMAGNVWEWVFDWYSDSYYASSPAQNPTGPGDTGIRVLRGGSWLVTSRFLRAAYRFRYSPGLRGNGIGFRCAR